MKIKKILSAVCAVILSGSIGITCFSGCKESCEHVYTWTTTLEATCSAEGKRDGVCGICGDVITESIAIDPKAHKYGEWQVTQPTQTTEGSATLTCTLNPAHKVSVTLPVLTDSSYAVTEITPATVAQGGESQYTYQHDEGDIVFTADTPAKQISDLQDIVDYAVYKSGEISKAAGITEMPVSGKQTINKLYYEFGDGYTHVYSDGDSREYYCTKDDAAKQGVYAIEISGVKYILDDNGYAVEKINNGGMPFQNTGLSSGYLSGALFGLSYTGISGLYGADNVLSTFYKLASDDKNKDLDETPFESMKQSDGSFSGSFSFGYYNGSNSRFCTITVDFELYDTGSIKSVDVVSEIYGYDSDTGSYGFVGYNEAGAEIDLGAYDETDEQGRPIPPVIVTCKVKPDATPIGIERIQIKQQRVKDVSVPVVANPYPRNSLLVHSFNVKYGNDAIVGDGPVEVYAGEAKAFTIIDVVNVADVDKSPDAKDLIHNLSYDPVTAYLREDGKDIMLTASTDTDANIKVNAVVNGTSVTIRCYRMGSMQIVLKTQSGNFEKVINVNVGKAQPPSKLEAQVNILTDNGYLWQPYLNVIGPDTPLTVFVGQMLEFTAQAPDAEQSYTDASYTAEIVSGNKANADIIDNNKFLGSATGVYRIKITSVEKSSVYTYMEITVQEAPAVEKLFGGYTAQITDPGVDAATITFKAPAYDETAKVYKGTVEISFLGGTEILSYTYTPATITTNAEGERVYSAPRLTTAHSSGAQANGHGSSLSINDGYKITLRHPRSVVGQFEEVVIVAK